MDTRVQDAISVQAVCRQCASSVQAVCEQDASRMKGDACTSKITCSTPRTLASRSTNPVTQSTAGIGIASTDPAARGIRQLLSARDSTQAGIRRKPGFSASRDSARERDQGGLGSSGICGIEWGRDPCLTHVWSVQSDDPQTSQSVGRPRRRQC